MDPGRGAQSPYGKGLKGGGIPPIPPLFEGSNGGDGKARDPEYKTWDRSRLMLSAVGLGSKMADSLPVLPFGISVLPTSKYPTMRIVYPTICRCYRKKFI